jgi:predicted flap endonuclease-1-like 5' DNA nuclease
MPDITAVQLALAAIFLAVGIVLGWFLRSDRCAREKIAINAGWQEQLEGREGENERLAEQNKSLMQQISQLRASQSDHMRRGKELAASLKQASDRRDELQRQVKDVRSSLETALGERSRLEAELKSRDIRDEATAAAQREKDNKIFKLSRELSSWQNRVPPLVEKFRRRDQEAGDLQLELEAACSRIAELEALALVSQTRIERVDRESLDGDLVASNDQFDETPEQAVADLQDQVGDEPYHPVDGNGSTGFYAGDFAGQALRDSPPSGHRSAAATAAAWTRTLRDSYAPGGTRDDLQKIKGVGPAIERTLHDLGIFRFEQIAQISEYDIDRIAARLKGFRSRIYREDWIGQARTLQLQTDGGAG